MKNDSPRMYAQPASLYQAAYDLPQLFVWMRNRFDSAVAFQAWLEVDRPIFGEIDTAGIASGTKKLPSMIADGECDFR